MSINAEKLHHLMKVKSVTKANLARLSGINDRTIRRILKGESEKNNRATTTHISQALGVAPEDLAQPPSPADLRQEQDQNASFYRHAFTLSGGERLNFDLVQHRYGVSTQDILKAAPALFALVAEMSLAKRRADLEAARAALPPVPAHLKNAATVATYRLEDVLNAEAASIAAADIFGRKLEANLKDHDMEADFRYGTPFAAFLWESAQAANPDAFSDLFGQNDLPHRLFPADLDTLTGDDRAAEMALTRGRTRIQAIPADLLAQDRTADRITFLASHLTEEDRAWLRYLDEITLDDLGLGEETSHGL